VSADVGGIELVAPIERQRDGSDLSADRFQSAREVADLLADCEAQLKENAKLQDFSRIPKVQSAASISLGQSSDH